MAPMGEDRADGFADELRLLRERAYGPEADIDSDSLALARLRSLERRGIPDSAPPVRRAPVPVNPDTWPVEPVPLGTVPTSGSSGAPRPPAPVEDLPTSEEPPPLASWWRRHGWAAPVAAAVVTAVASVTTTVAVLSLQRAPALILEQDETAAWPADDFGRRPDGALLFDDALGLKIITQPQGWGAGDETQVCLLISYGGLFTGGCASEPYLPTASLALTDELPDELHARFPDAAALEFVLDDGKVLVYETRR